MPHALASLKRPSSYSHCPLKKRPLKYDPTQEGSSDSEESLKAASPIPIDPSEPENLSTKPEDLRLAKEKTVVMTTIPSSSLSPPSVALVAGRVEPHPHYHHQHQVHHQYLAHEGSEPLCNHHHQLKSNRPLGPISFNAPASLHHQHNHHHHLQSKVNKPYLPPLNTYTPPPSNHLSPSSQGQLPTNFQRSVLHQPPSHFAPPTYKREPGSPPHISPPLSQEPAYPVLRIEENQKPFSQYNNGESRGESKYLSQMRYGGGAFHHHSPSPSHDVYYTTSYQLSPPSSTRSSPPHHEMMDTSAGIHFETTTVKAESSPPPPTPIVPVNVNGSVRYHCPDCKKSYSTHSGLTKHIQFHCSCQNKKSFICKFCEKVYVSLGALKMHIRTHTLPCKCNICGKAFSRPWLLQGHIRTHTGEKPFTCQHCHRAFADRSNLRAHLQTHSEVKKYSCKTCSKTFSRMSLLSKHEDSGCSISILPHD